MGEAAWQVGEKVYRTTGQFAGGEILTVEKVYKNGNAVVAGKQFRPGGSSTSRDAWNRDRIQRLTPDLAERIRKQKLHNGAMNKLEVLRKGLSVENINLDVVDALLQQAVDATIEVRRVAPLSHEHEEKE